MSLINETQIERFEKALWSATRKLSPELTAELSIPLTWQQFYMLYFINDKGTCKVTDLAETMEVKPSAITVMIDRLIKHGVVDRRHDEKDRRVVWIELTDKGRDVLEEVNVSRKKMIRGYMTDVDSKQFETFLRVFEQMNDQITKAHAEHDYAIKLS
ncbi:MarR family transcriptional regulator [Paenibacillus sp. RC67]|uniref:MarR family winged helix-turn-helix transcriptional regulator n=1 Tax=Paenibacillus sp. RC67 TaxID=3039392 RepID=UPI0024ADF463|nr:MarR family transcriptional regulator [Paenibacillus sp. RC67]